MEPDPVHWDEASARSSRYGAIVAPPLYVLHAARRAPGTPDPARPAGGGPGLGRTRCRRRVRRAAADRGPADARPQRRHRGGALPVARRGRRDQRAVYAMSTSSIATVAAGRWCSPRSRRSTQPGRRAARARRQHGDHAMSAAACASRTSPSATSCPSWSAARSHRLTSCAGRRRSRTGTGSTTTSRSPSATTVCRRCSINGSFKQHVLVALLRGWLEPSGWLAADPDVVPGNGPRRRHADGVRPRARDRAVATGSASSSARSGSATSAARRGRAGARPACCRCRDGPSGPLPLPGTAVTDEAAPGALEGVAVLEVGHGIAGRSRRACSAISALRCQGGAPGAATSCAGSARSPTTPTGCARAPSSSYLNWNKRGVVLELTRTPGRDALRDLAQRGGRADRLAAPAHASRRRGLAGASLRRAQPAACRHVGVSNFGASGPYARLARLRPRLRGDERRSPRSAALRSRAAQARASPVL